MKQQEDDRWSRENPDPEWNTFMYDDDDDFGPPSDDPTRDDGNGADSSAREQPPRNGPKAQAAPVPLRLTFFDDCIDLKSKAWIIKGVIARGECSSWFAPPKSMKSALLLDAFVHAAAGEREWRGHRIKQATGAIMFAFERSYLTKRRLGAYARRDGYKGLPIAVSSHIIDLLNPTCVEVIVATVRDAEAHFGQSVGLIGIDTSAKGIAAGGGDEDKARDQNIAAANLERVLERLPDIHIACIGHTGKDESRGERGSNAKLAHVDVAIQLTGDKIKTATVVEANDQLCEPLTAFTMEDVVLGADEDGDNISIKILSREEFECQDAKGMNRLGPKQKLAMKALHEVLNSHGESVPSGFPVPSSIRKVAKVEHWRREMERNGTISSDAKKPDRDADRHITSLAASGRIGIRDQWVWSAAQETP